MLRRWIAARRYRRALVEAAAATSPAGIEARLVALEGAHREASIAFDSTHPERAVVAYALACALLEAGRLDHAEARAEEAWTARRAAAERGDGPSDAAIAAARAAIAERQGRPEEQRTARLRDWVAACRSEGDREGLGDALNQLALALARAGKRDDAAALFDEALALRESTYGARARPTLEVRYNRATFRGASLSVDGARAELEAVVDALDHATPSPPDAALLGSALHNVGVLLDELGLDAEARARLERALTLREAALGAESAALRPTLTRLAQLHHRAGRSLFALPLYERAIAIARAHDGDDAPTVRALEAWRAELTEGVGLAALRR